MTQKTLGEKLRFLREQRRYTQDELSALLYIGRSAYSNYEQDKRVPSYASLVSIADFYGVKIDFLLRADFSGNPYCASDSEQKLLASFRLLEPRAKKEVAEYIEFRLQLQKKRCQN